MKHRIWFDEETDVLYAELTGPLEPAGMQYYQQELLSLNRHGRYRQLVDLSGSELGAIPPDEIRQQAVRQNSEAEETWTAMVVNSDHMYGFARLYMGNRRVGEGKMSVFRHRAEALAWLLSAKDSPSDR